MSWIIFILITANILAVGVAGHRANKWDAAKDRFWREYYGEQS